MVAANPEDPNRYLKSVGGRPYQFRVTIDRGPCFSGTRVTIPLRTTVLEEARKIRDILETALMQAHYIRTR